MTSLPCDPAAARALLQSAGYALPVEAVLSYRAVGSDDPAAKALKEMLEAAGFRVALRPVAWDQVQAELRGGRLSLFFGGLGLRRTRRGRLPPRLHPEPRDRTASPATSIRAT
jgi:Bacterial extracellular solute-binding proteins, family 5 Middle.